MSVLPEPFGDIPVRRLRPAATSVIAGRVYAKGLSAGLEEVCKYDRWGENLRCLEPEKPNRDK